LEEIRIFMNELSFYALPGFLGQSSDWDPLDLNIVKASIYKPSSFGLREWAAAFNKSIEVQAGKKILMGYSLGGRLAVHALIENPTLWQAAILISTHLGLSCPKIKQERLASDKQWAHRFSTETWDSLMQAWNAQPIFKDSFTPLRLEHNYTRSHLASILMDWSLARQDNLESSLEKLSIPVLWIAGELDGPYAAKAHSLQFSQPQSRTWVAPQIGHRVLLHKPDQLKIQIIQFIKGLL
jgi:2-succinyl-6-hydroxy-2,4-cyclohexadiene-1-carboxylate synthase